MGLLILEFLQVDGFRNWVCAVQCRKRLLQGEQVSPMATAIAEPQALHAVECVLLGSQWTDSQDAGNFFVSFLSRSQLQHGNLGIRGGQKGGNVFSGAPVVHYFFPDIANMHPEGAFSDVPIMADEPSCSAR